MMLKPLRSQQGWHFIDYFAVLVAIVGVLLLFKGNLISMCDKIGDAIMAQTGPPG